MSAKVPTNDKPWINSTMLKWAREWRGRTVEEAAAKLKKTPHEIAEWERNVGGPTVRQARMLADFYDRPFLELFLPEPVAQSDPPHVPDFRTRAGKQPPTNSWELRNILRWVDTQRTNALDLYSELGEVPAEFPAHLFATTGDDPEEAATQARAAVTFSVQDQISMPKAETGRLPNVLRQQFESLGILTLRRADLKALNIRGICLAAFPLPAVVFHNEALSAQAFTLAHELAHVLLRQSGITGKRAADYELQPIERWCDRFAAAFLMPAEQIFAVAGGPPPRPRESIEDTDLERLADIFRVSPHAMLIRLVHLGYVQSEYYWDVKKPQFDKADQEYRSYARSTYYGSRYRSSLGDLYTGLVLEAWAAGRITNHNAAEYMGIKNFAHLEDIRDKFGVS